MKLILLQRIFRDIRCPDVDVIFLPDVDHIVLLLLYDRVFCAVTPCRLATDYEGFMGTCWQLHQDNSGDCRFFRNVDICKTTRCHNSENHSNINFNRYESRDVAQAVSRWLPTAAARVRVRAACGVCSGQSGTGAGFLRVLRFPLPIIPPILHHHNHPGLAQIGLLVVAVPSGPSWTPPPTIPI
jgi:hypothetical protein